MFTAFKLFKEDFILEKVTSLQFPWYFNTNLVSNEKQLTDNTTNIQGFNHFLFEEQKLNY